MNMIDKEHTVDFGFRCCADYAELTWISGESADEGVPSYTGDTSTSLNGYTKQDLRETHGEVHT